MTEAEAGHQSIRLIMTSETSRKQSTLSVMSLLSSFLRCRSLALTVAITILILVAYYSMIDDSSDRTESRRKNDAPEVDYKKAREIEKAKESGTRKAAAKQPPQVGERGKKNPADDNRLSELTEFLKQKVDAKDYSTVCSAMEDRDLQFLTSSRLKDSDWINFSNVIKRCVLRSATTMWPFPYEKLKCCVGSMPEKLGVQFIQFISSVTYPGIAYKGKKLKDDLCYVVVAGMPKDPNDIKQLMTQHYKQCLFRGIDIGDDWFDHELQKDLQYDFNVLFESEVDDEVDMMLDEALEVFKLKYAVIDYIFINKNTTALEAIKFITNNRSPVICQLNIKIRDINAILYNTTTMNALLHAFVDESDLMPLWAQAFPTFEIYAINVIHPICRRRFITIRGTPRK